MLESEWYRPKLQVKQEASSIENRESSVIEPSLHEGLYVLNIAKS